MLVKGVSSGACAFLCLCRHFNDSHHRPSYIPLIPHREKQTSGRPPSVHAVVRMLVCVREQRWVCFPCLLRNCKSWSWFYCVCLCIYRGTM